MFVASGAEVRGYTKKGKQFLGFDTNLTESIQSMYVDPVLELTGLPFFRTAQYLWIFSENC